MTLEVSVTATLSSANDLLASHAALISHSREYQKTRRRDLRTLSSPPQEILRLPLIPSPLPSPPPSPLQSPIIPHSRPIRGDLPPAKRACSLRYENYVPEEETIRNDYSQRYVDGGEWPQNWVLGADPEHRFEEYPKQQRLLSLKKGSVASHALPPVYLPFSELSTITPSKFDVVLIDPPFSSTFTWDDLQELPIPSLAADPSFVLLWVGSGAGEGLERGRQVLAKWGFRRCEDIVWIKTNDEKSLGPGTDPPTTSLLTRTKQHCLMGIRGTVRRSTDSWFVHCNVDTDVMISAPSDADPTLKPEETYTLIENFCLGLRRLELFGRARTLRRGWVSVLAEGEEARIGESTNFKADGDGDQTMPMKWDRDSWEAKIKELAIPSGGKFVVPMTSEIDSLRPKSPVRNTSGTPQHLPTGLPHNPVGTSAVLATVNVNRGANAPASGRVMMGPPISVPSLPTGTFESGIINPILNWSDMSNMGGMQSNMGGMQGSPMGMGVQQPAPRIGFSNPPTFGGGFQQPSWETHGAGTWDDSGVFIGNTVGMGGGGGGGMGVPDMSMGGMGAMGMQGMPGMPHGMNGTGVHMGMGQNIGGMGQVGAGMSLPNTPAMGGMQGANNMRGMRVVGNGGLNNMGVGAMSMSNMRVGGMNMSGMNMGHWGGT